MSSTSFGPGRARRGLIRMTADSDSSLNGDAERLSNVSLVKQAVTALVISGLGLFAISAVAVAASPYSTASSSGVAGESLVAPDITRAVPADISPAAAVSESSSEAADASADSASRNADISRNAIRSELTKAMTGELANQRSTSLAQTSDLAALAAQLATQDARSAQIQSTLDKVNAEVARLADAARAAALADQVKALSATLVNKGHRTRETELSPELQAVLSQLPDTGFTTPLEAGNYTISAVYGVYGFWSRYHTGQDFAAAYGTPIRAVESGIVMPSDTEWWAGINVVLMHSSGEQTLYAHMSAKTARPGQIVKAGDVIGYVGLTGRTFGTHLHFEYYPVGALIGDVYTARNPLPWLRSHGINP